MTYRRYPAPEEDFSESFVTAQPEPLLPAGRQITAGPNITVTDTGTQVVVTATGSGGGGGASSAAKYVVMAADASIPNARVIQPGTGITVTDNTTTVTIAATGQALAADHFLVTQAQSDLPNSRVLVNSGGITITDNGSQWILSVDTSVVRTTGAQSVSSKTLANSIYQNTVSTVSTNYTIQASDEIVLVDASAAPLTITLPSAGSMTHQTVNIKKIDSSVNIVTVSSSDTIDGATSQTLEQPYESYRLVDNGSAWFII